MFLNWDLLINITQFTMCSLGKKPRVNLWNMAIKGSRCSLTLALPITRLSEEKNRMARQALYFVAKAGMFPDRIRPWPTLSDLLADHAWSRRFVHRYPKNPSWNTPWFFDLVYHSKKKSSTHCSKPKFSGEDGGKFHSKSQYHLFLLFPPFTVAENSLWCL